MKVTFSPEARDDLIEIGAYIAQDNPARALGFVDELEAACDRLGQAAGIGTARPELGKDIRMWPHGRYLVFYQEQEKQIRIERILHSSRDIDGDDFGAMNV
ncbi:MAG TPA: type II toxin-antitoxin system RelE/ParE family toxin [Burkholderiaceae bacterium]|nr:type II toxin-antitoxin system RelE/ParE family toxin [Burkholderiaceae bacterium]